MTAALPAILAGTAVAPATPDLIARLERHARHAQGALAPETERALRKASAAFTGWAATRGVSALPADAETVAAYVDELAGQGRKPASIRQAVWAIAALHRAAILPDPCKAEPVHLALKRMGRSLGTRQRQAAPLGDSEVARILATAGGDLTAIRDVACMEPGPGYWRPSSEKVRPPQVIPRMVMRSPRSR